MSVTRERVKKRAIFNDCDVELKPKPDSSAQRFALTREGVGGGVVANELGLNLWHL